eukprot:10323555-Alexandrium_andersonii.AAC.1
MSASLVGSEMCIRDRWGLSVWGPSWPGPPKAGRRWGLGPQMAGALEGTVSYTHLTLPTICSV